MVLPSWVSNSIRTYSCRQRLEYSSCVALVGIAELGDTFLLRELPFSMVRAESLDVLVKRPTFDDNW
jgi:hypothetical protein